MIGTETVIVHTVNFGDLEVPEDKIITFQEGLPGFPQIHRFTVVETDQIRPFQYLQGLDNPPIAFLVINPFVIDPNYAFQLSKSEMEEVKGDKSEDLTVYAVATVPENAEDATLNLMAPIVINEKNRLGKQVILHDTAYSVKHPLFGGSQKTASQA